MKNILPLMGGGQNFIYESMGGGGSQISFPFLASKCSGCGGGWG